MSKFTDLLTLFVQGQASLDAVEQELKSILAADPSQVERLRHGVINLQQSGYLDDAVVLRLTQIMSQFDGQAATQQQALPKLLEAFNQQQIGYRTLEKGLVDDLTKFPNKRQQYADALQALAQQEVLSKPVLFDLLDVIEQQFGSIDRQTTAKADVLSKLEQQLESFITNKTNYQQLASQFQAIMTSFAQLQIGDGEVLDGETLQLLQQQDPQALDAALNIAQLKQWGIVKRYQQAGRLDTETVLELRKLVIKDQQSTASGAPDTVSEDDSTVFKGTEQAEDETRLTINTDEMVLQDEGQDNTSSTSNTSNTTASKWSVPFKEIDNDKMITEGLVINERFEILHLLGNGGMGDVWAAKDYNSEQLGDVDNEVAIKVLGKRFRRHADSLRTLQREANKTRKLSHPNIVKVYDFDRDDYHVFMTMELMRGQTLKDAIRDHSDGFDMERVYQFTREIGAALTHAHQQDIIHSDLKPGNIFVNDGMIRVFDFGIARAANRDMQADIEQDRKTDSFDAGSLNALTETYASLEMFDDDHQPDPKDDIFAFGCIIYELLTGHHPFMEEHKKLSTQLAYQKKLKPQRVSGLKSWQWRALEQSLSFVRDERIASAELLVQQFTMTQRPMPIKTKVALGVVCGLVVGGGVFAVKYYQSHQIEQFISVINTRQYEQVIPELKSILNRSTAVQDSYFAADGVKQALIAYFEFEVEHLAKNDQHQQAFELLKIAQQIYTDSSQLVQQKKLLEMLQAERISNIDKQIAEIIYGEDFDSQYPQIKEQWKQLRKIDSQNAKLNDTYVAKRFVQLAQSLFLAEQSQESAQKSAKVIEFAQDLLANNQAFTEQIKQLQLLSQRIIQAQDQETKLRQIVRNEQVLGGLTTTSQLAEYQQVATEINALAELDPFNELLGRVQQNFNNTFAVEFDQLIAQRQFSQTIALVTANQRLLTIAQQQVYQEKRELAEEQFSQMSAEYIRKIGQLSRSQDPNTAIPQVDKFQQDGATPEQLAQVNDLIATGWLSQAKKQIVLSEFTAAQTALSQADQFDQTAAVTQAIADQQQILDSIQNGTIDQVQLQQLRQEQIKSLDGELRNLLGTESIDLAAAQNILRLVAELEILDANNEMVNTATKQVETLLERQVYQLVDQDLDQALTLATQAYESLPDSTSLAATLADIKNRIEKLKNEQKQQQLAKLAVDIEALIAATDLMNNINALQRLYDDYQTLDGDNSDNDYVAQSKLRVATRLIELATSYKDQQLFQQADQALVFAQQFTPDLATISLAKRQLDVAKADYQKQQEQQNMAAQIQSLQASFETQVAANDMQQAKKTLDNLLTLSPMDNLLTLSPMDDFLQSASVTAFIVAENRQIKQLFEDQQWQAAKQRAEQLIEYSYDKGAAQQQFTHIERSFGITQLLQTDVNGAKQQLDQALADLPNVDFYKILSRQLNSQFADLIGDDLTTYIESDQPCETALAGQGRYQGGSCYDMLSQSQKGPRLLVVPALNDRWFAMTKYELTYYDYNIYCNAVASCEVQANVDRRLPITNIAINDIQKYIQWLNKKTGKVYRIPTAEEWQYAAQANNGKSPDYINCKGTISGANIGGDGTLVAANFNYQNAVNYWGFIHVLGNVREVAGDGNQWFTAGGGYEDSLSQCTTESLDAYDEGQLETIGYRLIREL